MPLLESISTQEKVDFIKNLSLLIKSGKPVNESFDLLAKQSRSPALKKVLETAKDKTEKGTQLYKIFEESPHFGKVFVSFIRAGEESGTLDQNLEYLASWLERNNELDKEMKSATLYPKIIVSFALILSGVLSVFVLPQLVPIFGTLDVELPWATRLLLWVSETMQESGIYVIGGILGFIVFVWLLMKLRPIKRLWHGILLKLPVAGSISKEYQLTIIAQLITTLFQSGLTLNDSLDIIANSVTNIKFQEAIEGINKRVAKGTGFAETMEKYPELFPSVFISVVATGEQTGSYGDSFQYLADFFAQRVTERTKKLPTVIEPVLLIAIGFFVAFIAGAIILPIYEVTEGLY